MRLVGSLSLLAVSIVHSERSDNARVGYNTGNGTATVSSLPAPSEEDMRQEKVDVSFSADDDHRLTMTVIHNGDRIVCSGLEDDVKHATEIRQSDGSFAKVRGTGGYSLQSSTDGIDCRVAILNADQRRYTHADVPAAPGYLSARIVLANGEILNIERNATMGEYIHRCPHDVPHGARRRLQLYKFSCRFAQRKTLRMGVVIDSHFLNLRGFGDRNREKARQLVGDLWKKASVPYERQFNIKLHVSKLLFHDDPLLRREQRWVECGQPSSEHGHLNAFDNWKTNNVLSETAGWFFLIGCQCGGCRRSGGTAYADTFGGRRQYGVIGEKRRSVAIGIHTVNMISHEIGHMFGAHHTFAMNHESQRHRYRQDAGNGLMDYTPGGLWQGEFQFHRMHDKYICGSLAYATGNHDSLVSQSERWESDAEPPSTTTRRPTGPNPPSSTTASPPTGTDPPPASSTPAPGEEKDDKSNKTTYIILAVVAGVLLLCFAAMKKSGDDDGTAGKVAPQVPNAPKERRSFLLNPSRSKDARAQRSRNKRGIHRDGKNSTRPKKDEKKKVRE
eukprot:GEMP01016002.1.p1 GENE.GEMP01016002.1~~GEMP01016002.1.p1  ORF type:complete len:559 (+),score=94.05 GEMP01016002.1:133-1809(+)